MKRREFIKSAIMGLSALSVPIAVLPASITDIHIVERRDFTDNVSIGISCKKDGMRIRNGVTCPNDFESKEKAKLVLLDWAYAQ